MSFINTNQFATGFASTNVHQEFENAPNTAPAEFSGGIAQPSDNIQYGYGPISLPIAQPVFNPGSGAPYGGNSGINNGFDFSSIFNQIGNLIGGLFAQLGSLFGGASQQTPPAPAQTFYENASGSSVGDPHLTFSGTTGAGGMVSDKWDSMNGHSNLLDSNSFDGGYRVSTQTTTPNSKGVTLNASATVTTDGGATQVSMNKDGSYAVCENGHEVGLTKGVETSLGNGESVMLSDDGSLTVNDRNGANGSISTTMKSTGAGVDVTNSAHHVDLGGYLVNKTDDDADPEAHQPPIGNTGVPIYANNNPYGPTYQPTNGYQLLQSAPMVTGLEQFDPDAEATSLDNIAFA